MKKNILGLVAIVAMMASCEKAKITNEDIFKDLPVTQLDVKYSVDGEEVKSLAFNSQSHDVILHVDVNNENLKWKLESNRSWCVVKDECVGSSDVAITLLENEAFSDRSTATLTFVAGDFRGFQFSVDQTGTVFLVGQPYFILSPLGQSVEVNVTTPAGMEWEAVGESWMNVSKKSSVNGDEFTTTVLSVTAEADAEPTRFGKVELTASSGSYTPGAVYVAQFGNEFEMTAEGEIFLPADKASEFSFIAPVKTIETISLPKYASYTITPDTDITEKVTITIDDNLSDCQEAREVPIEVKLSNSSATVITFPAIKQDFMDAHGLMSYKGLQRFAKVVNEGGDISGWMRDGVVTMLQDIDMSDMSEAWVSIGTKDHPFGASFNGSGYKIKGLKVSAAPFFGICDGASLRGLTIDESCSFYYNDKFMSDVAFGALVAELKKSSVQNCKVAADVAMAGNCLIPCEVCLGAIAGKADEQSVVKACDVEGTITLSSTLATGSSAFVGGVAGMGKGEISGCTSASNVELISATSQLSAGGVTALISPTTKAANNTFLGSVDCATSSALAFVGGLYGQVQGTHTLDFATDKSSSMGAMKVSALTNASTVLSVGGFIGGLAMESDLTFNGFESTTSLEIDLTVLQKAQTVSMGGFIGGSAPGAEARLSASGLVNKGALTNPTQSAVAENIKFLNLGGCVGYVSGDVTLKNCDNQGSIGLEQITAKSNGYVLAEGGIIGQVIDGNCTIDGCTSSGVILNYTYNNNAWAAYNSNVSGGIIGAFDYQDESETNATAKISNCTVTGGQWGYRGICGGIVGYAKKAEISKCSCTGHMNGSKGPGNLNTNNHAYVGGTAGIIEGGSVTGCTAVINITAGSPGSESAQGGGIAGVSNGAVTFSECSYYGDLAKAGSKTDETAGGIVGASVAATTISSCKFGGSVAGQKISEMNASSLACGDGNANISGITYWNGQ